MASKNTLDDNSDDDVVDMDNNSDFANDKSQDNDNLSASAGEVAATTGGTAMSFDISDINLALTTSNQRLSQGSVYISGAAASTGGFLMDDKNDAEAYSEFESFSCVDQNVQDNIGITGVNASGGNFNNQANMSSCECYCAMVESYLLRHGINRSCCNKQLIVCAK